MAIVGGATVSEPRTVAILRTLNIAKEFGIQPSEQKRMKAKELEAISLAMNLINRRRKIEELKAQAVMKSRRR